MAETEILIPEIVAQRIHRVRGHKVMLDADLALLYNVKTRSLVQAVKRNPRRFPSDFMFQLTNEEWAALRSQNVTSKGRGGRRPSHRRSDRRHTAIDPAHAQTLYN